MPEFLQKILKDHFGEERSKVLWEKIEKEYEHLVPLANGETKGRKKNLVNGIYPFAAVYGVLLKEGMSREEAMKHMFAIMKVHTLKDSRKNYEKMGKLPFFFALFRKMFSIGLKGDSWTVEWVANDPEKFIYNIKTCLWHEACTKLGYPELCRIFCRNDELNFTDVSKHLYFERSSTLGDGGTCCDFHFYSRPAQKVSGK